METEKSKAAAPPYVAYRTLSNFLERFNQVVPGRIDAKLIGNSMSGGVRGQVIAALKSLKLISETGIPQLIMKRLCLAEGSERQTILREVVSESYPFVFSDRFDFSNATSSQLRELFEENTSATGETVKRCMAFLKDAAQDAGIAVSPFLTEKKQKGVGPRKRTPGRKAGSTGPSAEGASAQPRTPEATLQAQESLLLWGLFQRLPKPGSVWPKSEREHWTLTLANVLALEYRET